MITRNTTRSILQCLTVISTGILIALSSSCTSGQRRENATAPNHRDSLAAHRLNQEGLDRFDEEDLTEAESKFRSALECDLYYASAHNNLGLVLMQQKKYYDAAWEFQYAARLAPRSSEPRANLGLLYEHLGRLDQAAEEYEQALEIAPADATTMRHLARTYVKTRRTDDRVRELLHRLLDFPIDQEWDLWVRGQLVRLGRESPAG